MINYTWASKNICHLRDILYPDGTPRYNDIIRISGQGQNAIMTLNGIMSAIPSTWIRILRRQWNDANEVEEESNDCGAMTCTINDLSMRGLDLSSKFVYESLNKSADKNKWQIKWETIFDQSINWEHVYSFHKNDLLERKVKIFIWKSLNYGLNTKEKTKRMKIGNGKCSFCEIEDETVMHLFAECDYVRPIWQAICLVVRRVCNTSVYHLEQTHSIIFGVGNIYVDFIIAYAKWIIWKARNMIVFEQQWFEANDIYIWIQKVVNDQLYLYKRTHNGATFPHFY